MRDHRPYHLIKTRQRLGLKLVAFLRKRPDTAQLLFLHQEVESIDDLKRRLRDLTHHIRVLDNLGYRLVDYFLAVLASFQHDVWVRVLHCFLREIDVQDHLAKLLSLE